MVDLVMVIEQMNLLPKCKIVLRKSHCVTINVEMSSKRVLDKVVAIGD